MIDKNTQSQKPKDDKAKTGPIFMQRNTLILLFILFVLITLVYLVENLDMFVL